MCHHFNLSLRRLLTLSFSLSITLFLVTSCANQGSGPDGGPYDETPPRIINMSPVLGEKKAHPKKVTFNFDENIKLNNAAEKVIVSPPQIEMPEIKVYGKKITVELLDTLKENTTYTIDFSDAIEDNNEGNPMGQFTYFFSTGESVDTMEVSGTLLNAEDLEPMKGILVGLHSDTTDTAFTTKPFDRVARSDGNGKFVIKGVRPGRYRAYALKDMDNDFKMSRGEMIAFSKEIIAPSSFEDIRYDTLWRDTTHYDTIIARNYTHFTPDNIVLKAFTEKRTERYLLKTQRDEPEWFRIYFTAPSEHTPTIKGLNFDEADAFVEEGNPTKDTITYWLRDFKHFPSVDTLQMAYTYETFDDSTSKNVLRTDTFELIPRNSLARKKKQLAKEREKWEKKMEKRRKHGLSVDSFQEVKPLAFKKFRAGSFSPMQNIRFEVEEPLSVLDTSMIHLFRIQDTLKFEAPYLIERHPWKLTDYTIKGEWRPGQHYELVIDSAAMVGFSGRVTDSHKENVRIPNMEEYGALFLNIPDADSTSVVQLISGSNIIQQVPVVNGRADIFYLPPGSIYMRVFNDRNGNNRWDTGLYSEGIQPEEVFYFPVKIEIRANWDIEQTWRLRELPLTQQKPQELIKQKEKEKRNDPHKKNEERNIKLGIK